jgi:hypothetical protein
MLLQAVQPDGDVGNATLFSMSILQGRLHVSEDPLGSICSVWFALIHCQFVGCLKISLRISRGISLRISRGRRKGRGTFRLRRAVRIINQLLLALIQLFHSSLL